MALPKNVQRQLDEAEALAAQQNQQPAVVADVSQLQAPPPTPTPAPVAQAPVEPQAPPAEDWQHKYKTLQGVFQAEVPGLRAQVKRFESELAAAREQISTLTAVVRKQPETPPPATPQIDERDARAFGEDMVEMVNRYAQRTFAMAEQRIGQLASTFDQRIKALEQAVTGVSQRTESTMESQFYATLDQLVPDWKAINTAPEWLEWLGQVDEVYNVPRQTALDVAFERRDAPRVAAVFKQYLKSKPVKPAAAATMQTLITPSEGGGGPVNPPTPQAKPVLTQKAVQQFYLDVAKGRYRSNDADRIRLENEIDLAAREGRIV